jgi:hypothetical protein
MIGWRPVLLTLLAGVIVLFAVLHTAERCGDADSLREHGLLADARKAYVALLHDSAPPGCAERGLDEVTKAQCKRTKHLKDLHAITDAEAKKAYLVIAQAEPVRDAASCATNSAKG